MSELKHAASLNVRMANHFIWPNSSLWHCQNFPWIECCPNLKQIISPSPCEKTPLSQVGFSRKLLKQSQRSLYSSKGPHDHELIWEGRSIWWPWDRHTYYTCPKILKKKWGKEKQKQKKQNEKSTKILNNLSAEESSFDNCGLSDVDIIR